jgi:hypothetical protein
MRGTGLDIDHDGGVLARRLFLADIVGALDVVVPGKLERLIRGVGVGWLSGQWMIRD